jgi:light-regulated signal transduction histidine kinase (bacteriophytochrome)
VNRQSVDLSRIAAEVTRTLQMTKPDRRVEFRIAQGISAQGDPKLLRLVLGNLLGNAWKFTDKQKKPLIEFGAIESAGGPAYFVRDNGAGFDMNLADKLFVAFQRLHGSDDFAGDGIGLATVQRVIQRHGGRTWAEGEVGKGATFYFTLKA